jgi:hypothetical protein
VSLSASAGTDRDIEPAVDESFIVGFEEQFRALEGLGQPLQTPPPSPGPLPSISSFSANAAVPMRPTEQWNYAPPKFWTIPVTIGAGL